ncbi:hypothetical protein M885DRAFT_614663, partial [Pelagophyceae sp. CCMP2097]
GDGRASKYRNGVLPLRRVLNGPAAAARRAHRDPQVPRAAGGAKGGGAAGAARRGFRRRRVLLRRRRGREAAVCSDVWGDAHDGYRVGRHVRTSHQEGGIGPGRHRRRAVPRVGQGRRVPRRARRRAGGQAIEATATHPCTSTPTAAPRSPRHPKRRQSRSVITLA